MDPFQYPTDCNQGAMPACQDIRSQQITLVDSERVVVWRPWHEAGPHKLANCNPRAKQKITGHPIQHNNGNQPHTFDESRLAPENH
jgi:hypothetical protein